MAVEFKWVFSAARPDESQDQEEIRKSIFPQENNLLGDDNSIHIQISCHLALAIKSLLIYSHLCFEIFYLQ